MLPDFTPQPPVVKTSPEHLFELVQEQVRYLLLAQLTPATHLENDLGFDSLERLELSIRLEQVLGIVIPDAELEDWLTLADVLATVQGRLARIALPIPAPGPAK